MSLPRSFPSLSLPTLPWNRKPKPLAEVIWKHFTDRHGFREDIRQARLDLAEGRAVPLTEIPRDR